MKDIKELPDISAYHSVPFKVGESWYEVFFGKVREVFYGENSIIRVDYPFWQADKDVLNAIKKLIK